MRLDSVLTERPRGPRRLLYYKSYEYGWPDLRPVWRRGPEMWLVLVVVILVIFGAVGLLVAADMNRQGKYRAECLAANGATYVDGERLACVSKHGTRLWLDSERR